MIIEAAFTAWRYRIPGQGLINWPEFVTALLETGFKGGMAVEHEDDFWDGDDDPKRPEFSAARKGGFPVSAALPAPVPTGAASATRAVQCGQLKSPSAETE